MTRYELAERIGTGGMAEIFRGKALAAGGFEKPVAIKRILPHLSQDKRFVELLINEAKIHSLLRHRNIVHIFDVGLGPDGQYFLVMEYVDGADMGALQDGLEQHQTRLPIELGLYIGSEICEALQYAHSVYGPDGKPMRLVHRDVSPSNVLLSRSGEVKLTDFGIAKRAGDVTRDGGVRGKFAYISPEQGAGGQVDARSDVFSVGILLFEILLGQRLFSKLSDFEALRAVREGQIPQPHEIDPSIHPKLERILRKALAHSPNTRYPSAGELGKDLRNIRYSMPGTGGDPAKELAAMVQRYGIDVAPAEHAGEDNRTDDSAVVRLNSAPGFTLTAQAEDFDREKSYVDARQFVDAFEEEATRALIPLPSLADDDSLDATVEAGMDPTSYDDESDDAKTTIMDRSHQLTELRPTVPFRAASVPDPGGADHLDDDLDDDVTTFDVASKRAHPSAYDQLGNQSGHAAHNASYHAYGPGSPSGPAAGATASPDGYTSGRHRPAGGQGSGPGLGVGPPASGMTPGAMASGSGARPAGSGYYNGPVPHGAARSMNARPIPIRQGSGTQRSTSRRSMWAVAIGVIAAGVASFFIAGAVLGEDNASDQQPVDAAPPDGSIDAVVMSPDAGLEPAAIEPKIEPKPRAKPKRKKKKRSKKKRPKKRRRNNKKSQN